MLCQVVSDKMITLMEAHYLEKWGVIILSKQLWFRKAIILMMLMPALTLLILMLTRCFPVLAKYSTTVASLDNIY